MVLYNQYHTVQFADGLNIYHTQKQKTNLPIVDFVVNLFKPKQMIGHVEFPLRVSGINPAPVHVQYNREILMFTIYFMGYDKIHLSNIIPTFPTDDLGLATIDGFKDAIETLNRDIHERTIEQMKFEIRVKSAREKLS